jgi:tetraacyldisaccharide 4'-kinase
MIAAPRFWWKSRWSLGALALAPVAAVWSAAAGARMRRKPSAVASMPVICVGNFVVGGAGKTPTALAIARIAIGLGLRPGFLTRGYGGSAREPLRVDRTLHDAARVGDEALLLAEIGPVVVSPDRPAGLPLLAQAGIDLIIMDDGFQNPSLFKDVSIVVVDGAAGIGNGRVMPAGPLRAPLATQMVRADVVLIVGEGKAGDRVLRRAARAGRIVTRARLLPAMHKHWGERPFLAFAGIGRPEKFFNALDAAGAPIGEVKAFPDHYVYTAEDARKLLARAGEAGLRLITTTKDYARLLRAEGELARLRSHTEVFAVRMAFDNETLIESLIEDAISRVAMR